MSNARTGKVALVTGGGRDIGRAVALKLAACGAAVAVNYHASRQAAEETVAIIAERGGRAVALQADVTQAAACARLVQDTRDAFGDAVHILVNNAGGLLARKSIREMDEAHWDAVMDVNLKSVFLMTKAVLPYLPAGGTIVNVSSVAARNGGGAGAAAYAASKGAVLTLTRGMAKEFGPAGIRVNCVSPGVIGTSFQDRFTSEAMRRAWAANTPLRREGTAEEVAEAVAYLVSDAAGFVTGESLEINGGLYFV